MMRGHHLGPAGRRRAVRSLARPVARIGVLVLACFVIGGHSQRSSGVQVTFAWKFSGNKDGGGPSSALMQGPNGYLYGTAYTGAAGFGVVYSLYKPHGAAWQQTSLWTFSGDADGAGPTGQLIMDSTGALYGVTGGGAAYASGTVFKLTPPAQGQTAWTETTLYTFTHADDGGVPVGGLIADPQGNLYGTTTRYGANGYGTVFELSPPAQGQTSWTFATIHSFTGKSDGGSPLASLLMDAKGNLYGTAPRGGNTGISGAVFELVPTHGGPWHETTLYAFSGSDGLYPCGPLIADTAGNLYSTTPFGGTYGQGVAYELSPPAQQGGTWTESTIWSFSNASGLVYPFNGLLADANGNLFGAAFGYANSTYPEYPSVIYVLQPPAESGAAWTQATIATVESRFGFDIYWPMTATSQGNLIVTAQQVGKNIDTGGRHQTGDVLEVLNSGFAP
jgi:uncharacterized repeat protein (TIGR03803 family)